MFWILLLAKLWITQGEYINILSLEQPVELKEQLWYLAYVSFQHLKGEFEANASAIDAETSTSCQEPVTAPEVKSEEDLTNASSQEDVRATTLLLT